MKHFLLKNKTILLRVLGGLLLVVGFAVHFWANPKPAYSEAEIAAANVARMEASVRGSSTQNMPHAKKSSASIFAEEYQSTREKQMRYLTIIVMVLGSGFLVYSFLPKKKQEED
ncbi:MAG: hypothetical protein PHI89_00435 [Thiovulaceae bacterium]|nr:hypothetical protein [Sulfurimonadaceae bacterium]MDD3816540.1 hypothetical protein [Sulfurimonadaceae bacterium]